MAGRLSGQPDKEILGHAEDRMAAVEAAATLRPDVAVIDVSVPHLSGIEATRRITAEARGVRVVVLSMHADLDIAQRIYDAGAAAYVTKDGSTASLASTIRRVTVGSTEPTAV